MLEGLWLKTGKPLYLDLFRYWLKIFAITFAMGVVSGIVMSYQFGTNWSVFSDKAGRVIGPLMAYEVLTAFFLEAGFLGVMLFGMRKVGPGLHFAATLMVAIGTLISAFWILSANSWMQTPTGYVIGARRPVPARAELVGDHLQSELSLSPGPHGHRRLPHDRVRGRRGRGVAPAARTARTPHARKMFSMAMWMAALVAPVQIFVGDQHGLNTHEHQPAKIMAMEGHYESHPDGAPLYLFGIPNDREQRLDYAVGIPEGSAACCSSMISNAPMAGLDTVPDDDQPPASIIFWSFRIMVGHRLPDARPRPVEPVSRGGGGGCTTGARCTARRWSWGRPASSRSSPAGSRPRSGASRSPSMACCAPPTASARSPRRRWRPRCWRSCIVYFAVFGVGTWYILRLMAQPPHPHEDEPATANARRCGPPESRRARRRTRSAAATVPDSPEEAR